MKAIEKIEDLIAEEISGVGFLLDYIELYFDGPILRFLTNPLIQISRAEFQFPEMNSRDALCSLIGEEVRSIRLEDLRSMELITTTGNGLIVPLSENSRPTPEAMHFVPEPNGPIQVW